MSARAVRKAKAADIPEVARLASSRPFAAKWSRDAFTAELARPESIFLVVEGGGYALARVAGSEATLFDIAASKDGAGEGRALFAALKKEAQKRGCTKISFEVSALNARAIKFYEKSGAKVVGRRPKFYYDGSDAVLMDLPLP